MWCGQVCVEGSVVVVVAVVIEGAVVVVAMAEVVVVGLLVAAVDVGHQIPTGNIDLQYLVLSGL